MLRDNIKASFFVLENGILWSRKFNQFWSYSALARPAENVVCGWAPKSAIEYRAHLSATGNLTIISADLEGDADAHYTITWPNRRTTRVKSFFVCMAWRIRFSTFTLIHILKHLSLHFQGAQRHFSSSVPTGLWFCDIFRVCLFWINEKLDQFIVYWLNTWRMIYKQHIEA